MKSNNQTYLAAAGWAYVFTSGALLLLRKLPSDGLSWSLLGIFFIIALFASAVDPSKSRAKDGIVSADDLIVRVDGNTYTNKNGLIIGPERPDGKMVAIVIFHPSGETEQEVTVSTPGLITPIDYVGKKKK